MAWGYRNSTADVKLLGGEEGPLALPIHQYKQWFPLIFLVLQNDLGNLCRVALVNQLL